MPTLFDSQHLSASATQQPVTVLGRTFANDEERRTWFREELRKQLPELKQIDGFPIGEDDNILNLSDPPYYTACPNPWINDFITEWESEKAVLENQGKRISAFKVDEPYASDVSEGKNNPIYNAHSYHTKVPHPAIMRYILHYTQPGDIVFDGFAGTGMTGVAAGMCGNPDNEIKTTIEKEFKSSGLSVPNWGTRYAICGDLSPVASFIAANYNINHDLIKFVKEALNMLDILEKDNGWMYETLHTDGKTIGKMNYVVWSDVFICSRCNNEINFYNVAVDEENSKVLDSFKCTECGADLSKKSIERAWQSYLDPILRQVITTIKKEPVLINYSINNKKYSKKLSFTDLSLIEKLDSIEAKNVPSERMPEGDESRRNDKIGMTHVHQFYTKRNLLALSYLFEKAKHSLPLTIIFTSICSSLSSMLVRYNMGNRGNGVLSGTLYAPSLVAETNVFNLFRGKLNDFKRVFEMINHTNVTFTNSASSLNIQQNSVDYIFTDPPFGANIMYSELNFMQEAWLGLLTANKCEAIENKSQLKSPYEYQRIMTNCFIEYFRILKPNKWMTVEFSNTSAAIWNVIQTSLQNSGFIIANVSALDKQQGSFKAVNTLTAVKQDLVISCYKPSCEFDIKFQQSQNHDIGIWDFMVEHLSHLPVHLLKENATTAVIERNPKILFDRLIAFYVQRNLPVPIDAGLFQKGLRERNDQFVERDGMFFTAQQVHEYDLKKAEVPNFVDLSLFVGSEQDGIMWLKHELEHSPKTYQDLQPHWMQALASVRKGDILPELRDILEENFLQNESGAWYLPDLENEIDLEKVRTRRLLKQFDSYKEQASKPKGQIKEARVEALRIGFKQCYKEKDFKTIVSLGDCIPNNLLMEDEVLLQFYDIAISRV